MYFDDVYNYIQLSNMIKLQLYTLVILSIDFTNCLWYPLIKKFRRY